MTARELIKELQKLENIDGEDLLCLNVVFSDDDGDHNIRSIEVVESFYCGESRKVRLSK